ncbi:MAG: FtsX-like permease family protein [Desulfobacterales bacterium]|jgi:ABC-type antimicrobial peptide transport system permease subunit
MADQQIPLTGKEYTASVNRQIVLPFTKSVEISLKSIKVRFFRSLITTMSLVLAVSFLSFVRVSNDVANGLLATQDRQLRQAVIRAGYDIGPADTNVGASPKQRWIIILSLMVCVVGIVNAQLMAVTERFREIGTMKCLGALDRFILRLFILEAGMQGVAGAGAGALAGALFALITALLRYGPVSLAAVSWVAVIGSFAIAIAVGCILSLVGVLYPAIVAARMQPVEAMRVEQ